MKINFWQLLLFALLMILGINGIGGGLVFMIKPGGELMGMNTSWLSQTPFPDFLIPGILLFVFNGLIPLTAFYGLVSKKDLKLFTKINIFPDKHWAWTLSLYSGIITLVWIIVQQMIAGFFILQPIISAFGLGILIVALIPSVQAKYSNQ